MNVAVPARRRHCVGPIRNVTFEAGVHSRSHPTRRDEVAIASATKLPAVATFRGPSRSRAQTRETRTAIERGQAKYRVGACWVVRPATTSLRRSLQFRRTRENDVKAEV